MTYTLIFVFGFVAGLFTDSIFEERRVSNQEENKQKMMREIQQDIEKGYMPDLQKYKKKYNLK